MKDDPRTSRRRRSWSQVEPSRAALVEAVPETYAAVLTSLKRYVRRARRQASVSVNRELILLYWRIGREILLRQNEGWSAKVIDRLAADLRRAFPEMRGLSACNLRYMGTFAAVWREREIGQLAVAQLPWSHIMVLLDASCSPVEHEWYANQAIQNGWSRSVLARKIADDLFHRQGGAPTDFDRSFPAQQSQGVQGLFRASYSFDILLSSESKGQAIERGMIDHVRELVMASGKGFAFVDSQYLIEVRGRECYLDLLFYHYRLRCFVGIDLRLRAFEPEFAADMGSCLSEIDDRLRHSDDQPSIGIILCTDRTGVVAKYAVRSSGKPMGVAEYQVFTTLSERLELPSPEDLAGAVSAPVKSHSLYVRPRPVA